MFLKKKKEMKPYCKDLSLSAVQFLKTKEREKGSLQRESLSMHSLGVLGGFQARTTHSKSPASVVSDATL